MQHLQVFRLPYIRTHKHVLNNPDTMKKPQTAEEIRTAIQQATTRQRLEQLTIDALTQQLKTMGEPLTRPKMGHADMLFCRTAEIETIEDFPTRPIPPASDIL